MKLSLAKANFKKISNKDFLRRVTMSYDKL